MKTSEQRNEATVTNETAAADPSAVWYTFPDGVRMLHRHKSLFGMSERFIHDIAKSISLSQNE